VVLYNNTLVIRSKLVSQHGWLFSSCAALLVALQFWASPEAGPLITFFFDEIIDTRTERDSTLRAVVKRVPPSEVVLDKFEDGAASVVFALNVFESFDALGRSGDILYNIFRKGMLSATTNPNSRALNLL
jgi:hypothetical protein